MRSIFDKYFILILVLALTMSLLTACGPKKATTPPLDVTFLPAAGDFISQSGNRMSKDDILTSTSGAAYIIVGERHKNGCDHAVQQRLASLFGSNGGQISIGLEMVAVDKQSILDDFAAGQVKVDALAEELDWKKRWGYPFALFRGLFAIAQKNSIPVAALNVPPSVSKTIFRQGVAGLNEDQKAFMPGTIMPPPKEQEDFLNAIFKTHEGNATSADAQKNFFTAQSVWDTKMAEEAVRLRKKYNWPVLVLAGAGHVENGWGIASRIRKLDRGAKIVIAMPYDGANFDNKSGDIFFYCPTNHTSKMGMVLSDTGRGVLVQSVSRGSRADKAGLRPGDEVVEAQGIEVRGLMSLHMAGVKAHKSGDPLIFKVRRNGGYAELSLGKLTTKRTKPKAKK